MSKLPDINLNQRYRRQSTNNTSNNTTNYDNNEDLPKTPLSALQPNMTNNHSPLYMENKFTQLESKVIALEKMNTLLQNRLDQTEGALTDKITLLEMKYINNSNKNQTHQNALKEETEGKPQDGNLIQNKRENYEILLNRINVLEHLITNENQLNVNNHKNDLDLYKRLTSQLTEKMQTLIHYEIAERFKADLTNNLNNKSSTAHLQNQINNNKQIIDEVITTFQNDLKEMKEEASDRAQKLSKYIDTKIKENFSFFENKIKGLSSFMSQLTNQVKTNITKQVKENESLKNKIRETQNRQLVFENNFMNKMKELETNCLQKIIDVKKYVEINIKNSIRENQGYIKEACHNFDKAFNFYSEQLIKTRIQTKKALENLDSQNNFRYKAVLEDLKALCNRIYTDENIIYSLKENQNVNTEVLNKKMEQLYSKFEVAIINEKTIAGVEHALIIKEMRENNEILYERISNLQDDFISFGTEVKNKLNDVDEFAKDVQIKNIIDSLTQKTENYILNQKLLNLGNQITEKAEELDNKINTKTTELKTQIKEKTDELETEINEKTEELESQLNERTDELAKKIEKLDNISGSYVAIDEYKIEKQKNEQLREDFDQLNINLVVRDVVNEMICKIEMDDYINNYQEEQPIPQMEANTVNPNENKPNSDGDTIQLMLDNIMIKAEIGKIYEILNSDELGIAGLFGKDKKSFNFFGNIEKYKYEIEETKNSLNKQLNDINDKIDSKIENSIGKVKEQIEKDLSKNSSKNGQ